MTRPELESAIVAAAVAYSRRHIVANLRRDVAISCPEPRLKHAASRARAAIESENEARNELLRLTKKLHKMNTGREDFEQ